ncbi:MAG: GNAT family N-acetyltransferase [Planctomycetes bacterium]|nr:GNAT family N-acetyltransferase [Planctomycetota bacterium]
MEWADGRFEVSDDATRLQLDVIHGYLVRCYWSPGIPRDVVERAIANTRVVLGVYDGDAQVGFARVITDEATYAYLADVFVLESHRGRGLGKWLVECVHAHPALQGLRRWSLVTRDAHGLYAPFGWKSPADATRYMEIVDSEVYSRIGENRAAE